MRDSYLPKKVATPLELPDPELPVGIVVLFSDETDPNDVFDYGVWEEYGD